MSRLLVAQRALTVPGWVKDDLSRKARAIPSLDLRFADNKSLVDAVTGASLVTFTRASSGTFVGSDGVLRSAVTNLLLRSEEFDNAGWSKVNTTVTANSIAAPNGTVTADTITDSNDGAATAHSTTTANQSLTSGLTYTISVYAKAGTQPGIAFIFPSSAFTSNLSARFNISTGTIASLDSGLTGSITAVGDGWYRCTATATATATASAGFQIRTATASTSFYQGNGTGTISLWGAQLEQSATVGEYVPTVAAINSAPRFDHNLTTGESLGLLVEEARTNVVTNNTMVGAVAGTPGTNPTGWTFATAQSNGLTISIVGTGVENGINYIDYRFNGTTVASPNACAFGFTSAAAATSQTWTSSLYWKLASGTTTGTTSWQLGIIENTAVGTFVTGAFYTQATPTSAALITQRPTATRTLSGGVTVGLVSHTLNITVAGNTAIDFTIRIGMPQLEQGAFATSVIPTTTATVTRAADVASIGSSAFTSFYNQSEGTVYGEGSTFNTGASSCLISIDDTTSSNRIQLRRSTSASTLRMVSSGGSIDANLTTGTALGTNKIATGISANNQNLVSNGVIATGITSITPMPTVTQAQIGNGPASNIFNGTIKRLSFWPTRLSNTTLQAITQP